jgi:hypothetical protein
MSNEQEAQKVRADKLRQKIAQRNSTPDADTAEEHPEMLPGESPNEYVERRMRELEKKKKPAG